MSEIYKLLDNDSIILEVKLTGVSETCDRESLKNNLIETMKEYHGIGLSANQCGIMERMFVFYEDFHERKPVACFEPVIVEASKVEIQMDEGCLTWPGLWLKVKRPDWVKVHFEDETGHLHERKYSGLEARVFQHEMDHMEGTDFTKKVSKLQLDMSKKRRAKQLKKAERLSKQPS